MAFKTIARRTIPYPLGTYYEDKWCPHPVQTALAADDNGALAVQATLIVVGSDSDGEELLAHPTELLFDGK